MAVRMESTTSSPLLPAPFLPRRRHTASWLEDLQRRLRARCRNPILRQIAIADVELLPRGDRFWASGTERIAVVSLAPGLCGYATALRLNRRARAEFEGALADLCHVDTVRLRSEPVSRALISDSLVVLGQLGGLLGLMPALPASPVFVCGVAVAGAASTVAGYALAPLEEG